MHKIFLTSTLLVALTALADDPKKTFTDLTKESGIAEIVDAGQPAVAALGDGKGKFSLLKKSDAEGRTRKIPTTEIHLACDIDEDGKLDLQMTFQDGGGKWWQNKSAAGAPEFVATKMDLSGGQADRRRGK